MTRIDREFLNSLEGREPGERMSHFVVRVEKVLSKFSLSALQDICRERGLGIDELVYDVAARKLKLDREDVTSLLAAEVAETNDE